MRVGLVVQGQEGVDWATWTALAETAEGAGLESLFSSGHYRWVMGNRAGADDAWTILAALGRPADPERTIIGAIDAVVERLAEYADAGVDRFSLQDPFLNIEMIEDYGAIARAVAR